MHGAKQHSHNDAFQRSFPTHNAELGNALSLVSAPESCCPAVSHEYLGAPMESCVGELCRWLHLVEWERHQQYPECRACTTQLKVSNRYASMTPFSNIAFYLHQ
jgi:hypothetical protein